MTTYWNFDKPVYKKKRFVAKFVKKAPVDCTDFAKNNIPNYDTITSVPEEFAEMDFSETIKLNSLWNGMSNCSKFPDISAPMATSARNMFQNTKCSQIPNLYIPNVTDIAGMFFNVNNTSDVVLELKNIHSDKISNCDSLLSRYGTSTTNKFKEIISIFNTINVRNFTSTFNDCTSLILLTSINTRRGQTLKWMLSGCIKLEKIDTPIDLRCCTNITGCLRYCNTLVTEGIQFTNVPRTLDFTNIFNDGTDNSKNRYKIINYIETALNPDDVRDDDPDKLS